MLRPSLPLAPSLCLVLAAATAWLPGQEAEAPADVVGIRSTAHLLTPQGDALFGLGANYVATFARDGVHFVPALGPRVAQDQELHVALQSIHRGGLALPLRAGVAPVQEDTTAVYVRSATVRERYDVRADGVEQSFHFTALPGRGDLVVRCALGGSLAEHAEAARDGGLQFLLPDLGGATIGTVTGIDAAGARCTGGVRLVDGALELSLPAAFVDHAVLPLVLDPLIGARIDFTASPGAEQEADVAFAGATGAYYVVWANTTSTTQSSLVGRLYHPTTGLGATQVLASAGAIRRPKIAYHRYQHRFVVVYEKATGWLAPSQLACRIVEGAGTLGPITDPIPGITNGSQPALSGNPSNTIADNGGLLACRQTGLGVVVVPYTLPIGTGNATFGTPVTAVADPTAERPRLSKSGSGTRLLSLAIDGFVRVLPIGQNGAPVGLGYDVATGPGNVLASDVDGQGQNFLFVHESGTGSGREITARMLALNPNNQSLSLASSAVLTSNSVDDRDPVVALLGPKFAVAWTQAVGFLDYAVKVRPLATAGCTFCGSEATLTGPFATQSQPAIASCVAGGDSTNPQALVVCQSATQVPPVTAEITATQFSVAFGTDTQPVLWGGCGQPVTMSTVGPFALGNSTFGVRVSAAATAPIGLFLFGFGGVALPCGVCTAVNPAVLVPAVLNVGTATFPIPVPCNSIFLGYQLDAQVGVLDAVTNVCPLLDTLSLSPARRLTLVE